MENKKISVIMASWLGAPNRKNLDTKFIRAVKSFLNQTYKNKELIIISDGCQVTEYLYDKYFKDNSLVKFKLLDKQPLYSGNVRNTGLEMATGDIISYLDSDDVLGKKHLEIIANGFKNDDIDYVYYNDYMVLDKSFKKFQLRKVDLRWAKIGTSSISHKNLDIVKGTWPTGYGHDFIFMMKLNSLGLRHKKLQQTSQYFVAHYANGDY